MDDLSPFSLLQTPTVAHPLLGQTILIVEDSLFACEALRQMSLRSGARIRRADSLAAAHRHLRVYRPTVAIIDLGLPDGSGAELIEELSNAVPRLPVILGTSGDVFAEDASIAAGSDGFLAKPVSSLAVFQTLILRHLPADLHPPGPRKMPNDRIAPDPVSLKDDLAHAVEALEGAASARDLAYVAQFLSGIARSVEDKGLLDAANAISGADGRNRVATLRTALQHRLANQPRI
ncbi:response regulator [Shimia biformata]|uniref:response regulator n=1 Tax=Shimia biformata TaxID=1294299 RepID=UPI00194F45B7|nr:response regulator [Shimia biformata]